MFHPAMPPPLLITLLIVYIEKDGDRGENPALFREVALAHIAKIYTWFTFSNNKVYLIRTSANGQEEKEFLFEGEIDGESYRIEPG